MESASFCDTRGFYFIPTEALAAFLGADEPGARFLVGALLGFPIGLAYLVIVKERKPVTKHLYFVFSGLLVGYFMYGLNIIHAVLTTLVTWYSLKHYGGTMASVIFAFVFHMMYLMCSYHICQCESYTLDFSISQMVVCLKAIGLAWDVYDGRKEKENPSLKKSDCSLDRAPSLLEVMGHMLFFGCFLAGPQFALRRYKSFVEGTLIDDEAEKKGPKRYSAALTKFLSGMLFALLTVLLQKIYPTRFFLSKGFQDKTFLLQYIHGVIWVFAFYCKYFTVWSLADSCSTLTGVSYSGKTKDGGAEWNGTKNIDIYILCTKTSLKSLQDSINIATNSWASKYLFQRTRPFLGTVVSALLCGLFIGLWHGIYMGCVISFLLQPIGHMIYIASHRYLNEVTEYYSQDIPLPFNILLCILEYLNKWGLLITLVTPLAMHTWKFTIEIFKSRFYIILFATMMGPHITLLLLKLLFSKGKRTSHDNNSERSSSSKKSN